MQLVKNSDDDKHSEFMTTKHVGLFFPLVLFSTLRLTWWAVSLEESWEIA